MAGPLPSGRPPTRAADADGELIAREFVLTPADFERVRQLIYRRAGISLAANKHDMVYSRLARRLRALHLNSFREYLDRLETGADAGEWEAFVNALTTNLTAFFREAHHFEMLRRQLQGVTQRPIRIWCAAAATGEEAWSLAITACEAFATLAPPVQILASDIDTQVLKTAQEATYAADRLERVPLEQRRRYFIEVAPGRFRVRPELTKLVGFQRINLLDASWPSVRAPLAALFCRNVMIYFDKETQYRILKKFVPLLCPEGLLYAGHSESLLFAADLFRPLGRTVFACVDGNVGGQGAPR